MCHQALRRILEYLYSGKLPKVHRSLMFQGNETEGTLAGNAWADLQTADIPSFLTPLPLPKHPLLGPPPFKERGCFLVAWRLPLGGRVKGVAVQQCGRL